MDQRTLLRLNELNRDFYQKVAPHFDETRQQPWAGWKLLTPLISELTQPQSLFALDVGCGNGRWGAFLQEVRTEPLLYVGIDSSQELLAKAEQKLSELKITHTLINLDLVTSLLNSTYTATLFSHFSHTAPHVITLFGVMHHVPSFELRHKLLEEHFNILELGGLLIFTTWQFTKDENLLKRQLSPALLAFDERDLEPNDYILDWQRGQSAYRYCHFVDQAELDTLIRGTAWKKVTEFDADGKEQLNHYVVLQKPH
jgi:tRNA (uracil-5-)-methyltransferase TRM9